MNKETLAGKWHEIKGTVKEKWGKLTDSDIAQINGKREVLLGKLESRYGFAKEKAEKELQDFEKSCGCSGEKMQGNMASGKNQNMNQPNKNLGNKNQEHAMGEKTQSQWNQGGKSQNQDRNANRGEKDFKRK